jgi:glyoxylase-like metal-dependent hydrolase (beta-lactamase superfamily II)
MGLNHSKILVDTGQPDVLPYLQNLVKSLEEDESRIEAIVATHWHIDHTGGIAQIRKHYSKVALEMNKSICPFPFIPAEYSGL